MNKSPLNTPEGKVSLVELLQVLKIYNQNKWIIGKQCGGRTSRSLVSLLSRHADYISQPPLQ